VRNPLRRDRTNLENRLRDERPAPSDDLIRRLSGATEVQRAPRRRFGLVIAMTALIVVAFALTGGIGYAASSASKGTSAVKQLVTGKTSSSVATTSRSNGNDQTDRGSAWHQYHGIILICHKPQDHGGVTILILAHAWSAHQAHGDYLGLCRHR
jgi:hypothetical protein